MTTVRVMNIPFTTAAAGGLATRPVEVLPPVEVTTDRLNFRPLAMADRDQVLAALDRTRDMMADRIPLNRTDAAGRTETDDELFARWVDSAIDTDNNRSAWRRAAFLDDGTFVGCFNLIRITRGLDWSCEANCWVDAALQGSGYAREGVEALLHFATADLPMGLGLHRVIGWIQPGNTPSRRVAESLGFRATGARELLDINGIDRAHEAYAVSL
ncbi:MAG: GNAT family N-acetyltransferase [Planctomycetota bacterium]